MGAVQPLTGVVCHKVAFFKSIPIFTSTLLFQNIWRKNIPKRFQESRHLVTSRDKGTISHAPQVRSVSLQCASTTSHHSHVLNAILHSSAKGTAANNVRLVAKQLVPHPSSSSTVALVDWTNYTESMQALKYNDITASWCQRHIALALWTNA